MSPSSQPSVGLSHHQDLQQARHLIQRNVLLLLGYYNIPMHLGIARYAHEAGWSLCDEYVRVGTPPLWWRGDGILSIITSHKDLQALDYYGQLPLVDLSKGWLADTMPVEDRVSGMGKPRVIYDNQRIGRMGAEHFLNRGFKHVAYLNTGNYWLDQERIPSFRETAELGEAEFHEIEFYRHVSTGSQPQKTAEIQDRQWLIQAITALPKPIGIMVTADDHAPRLMQACDDAGIAIPEEVAILGCDNDPMVCDYAPVPLSSVDNDWDRIGYEAAKLLDQLMNGATPPDEPIQIQPKGVITRQSTDILAVPDAKIARALRFIWQNFSQSIGTMEVADAAGLNRRKLERGFRKHLHRSVNEEIMRSRINFAKKLLLETEYNTDAIAGRTGFSSAASFSAAFTRITGTRPGRFRKDHSDQ